MAPSADTHAAVAVADMPAVDTPAVEAKAPEVPSVGEVSADVAAKVDGAVAKAVPDVPSAEVSFVW